MRYLDVDLDELAFALDFRPEGMNHYLDLESGQVVSVSEESRGELERLYAGIEPGEGETPPPLEQLLQASPLHDWQKEEVRQAAAVEAGDGTRFVALGVIARHQGLAESAEHFQRALEHWEAAWRARWQTPAGLLENKAIALLCLDKKDEALQTLAQAIVQMTPGETITFDYWTLLQTAPAPPVGVEEAIAMLKEAQARRG